MAQTMGSQSLKILTFHAERGRSDADYNHVIIEFKNVGLFHGNQNSAKFQEALEELSRYLDARFGYRTLTTLYKGKYTRFRGRAVV